MKDKFSMGVEENVFVAKRLLIDSIWKSANLEGIAVTYPETAAVYDGLVVDGMKVDEIIAINNLKRGWEFILSHTDYETDFNFVLATNSIVGGDGLVMNAGYLRELPVKISGTNWIPNIPNESKVKKDLNEIVGDEVVSFTEKALNLMLYLMRTQAFYDGNKRTATLVANHYMISNGRGIISIPTHVQQEFRELLINFYETNNDTKIKRFLYDNAVDGVDFSKETKKSVRSIKDIPLTKKQNNREHER